MHRLLCFKFSFPSLLFFLLSVFFCNAQDVKVAGIFGDNMVLQRDKPIKFWGTAQPGSNFSIEFANKSKLVVTSADGEWQVTFPKQKAGGVYELKVMSSQPFSYKNILMGDVWLTSGQSNMDFSFGDTDSLMYDVMDNNNIRYVSTPTGISNYPQKDFKKLEWKFCTKENAPAFTAVGYYFAQKINKETGIPIGIIHTSWGGTSIKAWTSEKGITNIPEYKFLLDSFISRRNTSKAIDSINTRNYIVSSINNNKIIAADKGYTQQFYKGIKADETLMPVDLPGSWQTNDVLKDFRGTVWLTKEIDLPATIKNEMCIVQFGKIWAVSEIYANGVKIGGNNYYNRSNNRFYVRPDVLMPGKNVFVVRTFYTDTADVFRGSADELYIRSLNKNNPQKFSLAGQWQFTTTITAKEVAQLSSSLETNMPNTTVSSIFNVKINPLLQLPVKGILWYQGENDAPVGFFYGTLFKNMITDWRQQFNQGDLPFIFAQLPGFGKIKNEPVEKNSEWADIREAQAAALSLPNTAMAVTLELGNPNDIHPHNKKPVGERMADDALKMVYHFKNVAQSPMFKSYKVMGNEVHVYFSNAGTGLSARNNEALKGFAIAGADKNFVWADAKIVSNNEIVISNSLIKQPASVRYAWANSPVEANLINKEGLPAAPFRTDNWMLYTQGKVDNK